MLKEVPQRFGLQAAPYGICPMTLLKFYGLGDALHICMNSLLLTRVLCVRGQG